MAKKAFALILALILLCSGLAGCSVSKTTIEISASPREVLPGDVVCAGYKIINHQSNRG